MATEILSQPIGVAEADPRVAVVQSDMTGPRTVEAAGELAGEVIQGVQKGRALRGIGEDVERFNVLSEANRLGMEVDPETGQVTGSVRNSAVEAKLQASREQAKQKFREIALANEQHGVYAGSMAARLHTERTVRDLAMQTPGFEAEIRQTAASVLGYDPMGFGMRQILDVDKPSNSSGANTEIDKWRQLVELNVLQWNAANPNNKTSYPQMEKALASDAQNRRAADSLDARISNGDANFAEVLDVARTTVNPFKNLYDKSKERIASGQGWSWSDHILLKNEMINSKEETKQHWLAKAKAANPNGIISAEAADKLNKTVDDLYDPWETILSSSTATAYLEAKGAQLTLMSQERMRQIAPGFTMIAEGIKDPTLVGYLMDVFFTSTSDEQAALLIQGNSGLKAIFDDGQEPAAWLERSARELFGMDTVGVGDKAKPLDNLPPLSPEDRIKQDKINAALMKDSWKKASPAGKNELVRSVALSEPKLALGVISADTNSFRHLDEESRKLVAKTQGTEINAVVQDLAVIAAHPAMNLQVDSATGEIVAYRVIKRGSADGSDAYDRIPNAQAPAVVRRFNSTHRQMYDNPNWRDYLSNGGLTSAGEAAGLIVSNAQLVNQRAAMEEARAERDTAMRSYSSLVERGYKPDNEMEGKELKRRAGILEAAEKSFNDLVDSYTNTASQVTLLAKGTEIKVGGR